MELSSFSHILLVIKLKTCNISTSLQSITVLFYINMATVFIVKGTDALEQKEYN